MAASPAVSSLTSPSASVNGLRFAIAFCLPLVGFSKADYANAVGLRNIAEQMQSLIQVSNCNAPRLAVANLGVESRGREVEVGCPIEGKSALANIPRVLGGVVRDRHTFIVYAIRSCERLSFGYFRRQSSRKKRGLRPA